MTTLRDDQELPFGHPGRGFDDTPIYFDHGLGTGHGGVPDCTPDDEGVAVHYSPGDRPLCGAESWVAVMTGDPALVAGCGDCLELVEEDLGDNHEHAGRCLHCRQEVRATGGVQWRRTVRRPCPHCGRSGW